MLNPRPLEKKFSFFNRLTQVIAFEQVSGSRDNIKQTLFYRVPAMVRWSLLLEPSKGAELNETQSP